MFHQEFDPFGAEVAGPNTELTRSGFTGHEHDRDLGLVDMKGRVYDPLAGRFTTQDPIVQAPHWSQGLNRYAYVFNDPVNSTDPSGFMVDAAGSGGGIMAVGLMTGGLGAVTYQGFASGMASPATAGLGAVNIGIKLLTGMPGMSATPSARMSLATGSGAATTQPGANGAYAVGQGDSLQAPADRVSSDPELEKVIRQVDRDLKKGDLASRNRAISTAAEYWGIDLTKVGVQYGSIPQGNASATTTRNNQTGRLSISVYDRGVENARWLVSTMYHESIHVRQNPSNWARSDRPAAMSLNEVEANSR